MEISKPPEKLKKLDELKPDNIKLSDLQRLPDMTSWFVPSLLFKLLKRVVVSDLFGQYADRRLIEAALDPVKSEELVERALGVPEIPIVPDAQGAIWVDYVADLGDGFDSTYAIAYLLAQPTLKIEDMELPRATILVMGGDEVYPTATREEYRVKMRLPYELAWPLPKEEAKTPLVALPGNHDWYDGLVNFLAVFCRDQGVEIGGWKTIQKRSYFAVKLSEQWWLWGIDIALVRDMDQPQADYFTAIAAAKEMKQNANIILCSAEPGWYSAESNSDSYKTLSYAALLAKKANKELRIPLVLSGDSHHYARYSGDGSQYITSGGGGAFLHGTLELKPEIDAEWLQSAKEKLLLEACYPSQEESRALLSGNFRFPSLNKEFSVFFAGHYIAGAFILTYLSRIDVAIFILLSLCAGIGGYSYYQENSLKKTILPAAVHAVAHFLVIVGFSWLALWLNERFTSQVHWHWFAWLVALAIPGILIGSWIAGKIFGWSLELGCRYFDISHNDAFSAMRLNSHRHFLRIRLHNGEAIVYAIKAEKVPHRLEWLDNPAFRTNPGASRFAPPANLKAEFIEIPIKINAHESSSTTEIKNPDEVASTNK